MEKTNSKIKENVASGLSSAAGAAAGVVLGSLATHPAAAAQPDQNAVQSDTFDESEDDNLAMEVENSEEISADQPDYHDTPDHNATPDVIQTVYTEPQVEVLEYATVEGPDGSPAPAVLLSVDGTTELDIDFDNDGSVDVVAADVNGDGQADIALIDETGDGIANVAMIDENGDGQIGDDEVYDITEEGIQMPSMPDGVENVMNAQDPTSGFDGTENYLAMNDDPDYVNDADVDSFLA